MRLQQYSTDHSGASQRLEALNKGLSLVLDEGAPPPPLLSTGTCLTVCRLIGCPDDEVEHPLHTA